MFSLWLSIDDTTTIIVHRWYYYYEEPVNNRPGQVGFIENQCTFSLAHFYASQCADNRMVNFKVNEFQCHVRWTRHTFPMFSSYDMSSDWSVITGQGRKPCLERGRRWRAEQSCGSKGELNKTLDKPSGQGVHGDFFKQLHLGGAHFIWVRAAHFVWVHLVCVFVQVTVHMLHMFFELSHTLEALYVWFFTTSLL